MAMATTPEVVVITGASAGVGRATAQAFARRGAHIGLLARGHDGLEGTRREVETLGGKALVVPADVSAPDQVEDRLGGSTGPGDAEPVQNRIGGCHQCWKGFE